jgi:uncharacterized phiE125 gp8 family phage protein
MSMHGSHTLTVTSAPSVEPITVAEAKEHLRVSSSTHDTYIGTLLTAARGWVESFLGRSLIRQTIRLDLPCFEDRIYLPRGKVISVTTVKYVATDGTLTTLATSGYTTFLGTEGADYIALAYDASWPNTRSVDNAVQITYVAGYAGTGSPEDVRGGVPQDIKTAIKFVVQTMYDDLRAEDRAALTQAAKNLLWPHRLLSF